VRQKSEARRRLILQAAKAAFEELGFEQASMSAIAARVGGSKATLYNYFKSKDELFQALVADSADQHISQMVGLLGPVAVELAKDVPQKMASVMALLEDTDDIKGTLCRFGEQVLRVMHTPEHQAVRRMVLTAAQNPAIGRLFYERGPGQGARMVEQYFSGAIASGKLRNGDPAVMAAHFRALIEAESHDATLFNLRGTLCDDEIITMVGRAVQVFLAAYGA
jgi:AcrR family transcriptional regulator